MPDTSSPAVITRFAPSPTGHLHIGGARTAIFSWLLARHFNGRFVLRIEDTDLERSRQEYTDSILASMRWLGLDWDGEAIFQRQRFALYNGAIDRLLDGGHAYWCACPPEEVEAMREKARAEGKKPRYDGRCRARKQAWGPGRAGWCASRRRLRARWALRTWSRAWWPLRPPNWTTWCCARRTVRPPTTWPWWWTTSP